MKRKNIFRDIFGLILCAGIIVAFQHKEQTVKDIAMKFIEEYQQKVVDKYAEPFTEAVLTAFPK